MPELLLHGRGYGTVDATTLRDMHELRYRVFKERMGWDVLCRNGVERDYFDDADPLYLIYRNEGQGVQGCLRLMPTTGPNMLRDTFPILMDGEPVPADPFIWESSRFSVDATTAGDNERNQGGLNETTSALLAGVHQFALAVGLTNLVSVYDVRIEKILKRAGCDLTRIGKPRRIGKAIAVAGSLVMSHEVLERIMEVGELSWDLLPLSHHRQAA